MPPPMSKNDFRLPLERSCDGFLCSKGLRVTAFGNLFARTLVTTYESIGN